MAYFFCWTFFTNELSLNTTTFTVVYSVLKVQGHTHLQMNTRGQLVHLSILIRINSIFVNSLSGWLNQLCDWAGSHVKIYLYQKLLFTTGPSNATFSLSKRAKSTNKEKNDKRSRKWHGSPGRWTSFADCDDRLMLCYLENKSKQLKTTIDLEFNSTVPA